MPNNKLVKKFWELVKDEYEHLTFEQFNQICLYPYEHFRKRMCEDDIPDIRIKHLGSFQIFATPILEDLNHRKNRISKKEREQKKIYPGEYKIIEKLENYVKNNPQVFRKNDKKRNTSD